MPDSALAPAGQACVWMRAGLIRHRLCRTGFDCEHCLLDAALRGEPRPGSDAGEDPAGPAGTLPDDRLYSSGHTWLKAMADPAVWRFGIDPFATAILGCPTDVSCCDPGSVAEPGQCVCRIRVAAGTVSLAAPVSCRVVGSNPTLRARPETLSADPCRLGWILELTVTDPAALRGFLSPAEACEQLACDLTRFRRAVALELLTGRDTPKSVTGPMPEPLLDLRAFLGAAVYLDLLAGFVH